MKTKLTVSLVRRVTEDEPPAGEVFYWDTVVNGFCLRVRPPKPGANRWPSSYHVQWRAPNGDTPRLTIGHPSTHKLEEAREAAKAELRKVDAGGDPRVDREAARAVWSVADLAREYLASSEFAKKSAKTRAGDTATLQKHIVPRIGKTMLTAIDVPAVKRLHRAVENDTRRNRRKRRMGGPGAARKAVRLLSAAISWAIDEGEGGIKINPIIGNLRLPGDGGRETVIHEPAHYAALFAAMDRMVAAYEAEQAALAADPAARRQKFQPKRKTIAGPAKLRPASRVFLIVAASTGMRSGEIARLTWDQVDLAGRRITLHGTSKGAKLAKKGIKTETISLPPIAAAALATLCPEQPSPKDRVFIPARGALYAIHRDWVNVRTEAGLPPDLVLHGLRHSVGTAAVIAGLSTPEVQAMLRHRNITTTMKYVHLAETITGRLQDRAMGHLLPAPADPAPAPPGGAVVPIRRAR